MKIIDAITVLFSLQLLKHHKSLCARENIDHFIHDIIENNENKMKIL